MNLDKNKKHLAPKIFLSVLLFYGLTLSINLFAGETYLVSAKVFRLGEMIASPELLVGEGVFSGGSFAVSGQAEYRFVVLIRAAAENQVSLSLEWTSGNINLQPDLLVDINKETSFTINETRMVLLVERQSLSSSVSQTLTGTSWWVEDIAGKGVIDMSHTTIEFSEEGKVTGDSSCNRYFGAVEIVDSTMKVGDLAGTRKMCAPAQMDQEMAFYEVMGKVINWEIAETGLLHLRDADGVDQLRASRID